MATTPSNDLFSSLISDIKSYSGDDPLLPWLRGVKKLKESLPPQLLNEKLPRFLQKCAQTFESDRRYRNDLRFIRVWLHLMDYVDDPKALLRTMETKRIGVKRALFYQAYALYYEKIKKFEDAEKMYRLGVQNLAEPLDELQKSYEQFLVRLGRHKYKRVQRLERRTSRRPVSERTTLVCSNNNKEGNENPSNVQSSSASSLARESSPKREPKDGISGPSSMLRGTSQNVKLLNAIKSNELTRDDSAVAKFVDSAIVGKSEAENACHHGLVEPTINTKEAMDAINNMFREPFEPANIVRRSTRSQPKIAKSSSDGIAVFIDEDFDNGLKSSNQESEKTRSPLQETLQIFIDDEEDEVEGDINRKDGSETSEAQTSPSSSSRVGGFVFLKPDDYHSESSDDVKTERSVKPKFREDTVVCRFVGSAILDEPEVENICHHGLVDPTVNLKQAIDDINSMFGKPIDFVRATRKKRKEKAAASGKMGGDVFTILPDEDLVPQEDKKPLPSSRGKDGDDLFEPTVFTKQAMDDINDMFRMPLDF